MEQDYGIESLADKFSDHATMFDLQNEKEAEAYIGLNPGEELPSHFKDPFNLARALSVMACEIEKLKTRCS